MNSFGTTVLRSGKRAGGGEQGEEEKEVGSGTTERGGSAKVQGKSKGNSEKVKLKQVKDKEAAEQALGAFGRTRVPFTVDESIIAPANDTTLRAGSESEPSVEVTLEEWPTKAGERGQLYGHAGWVVGGDEETLEEELGAKAPELQAAHDAAADPSQRLKSRVAAKQAEREGQGGPKIHKGKKLAAAKKTAGALEVGADRQGRGRLLLKPTRDEFALSDDDEDERSREKQPEERSGGVGKQSGGVRKRSRSTLRDVSLPERGRKSGAGCSVGSGTDPEGDGAGQGAESGPPANELAQKRKDVEKGLVLDEHRLRSELKARPWASVKVATEETRRQAGAEKRVPRDFEEFVEEVRQAEPLALESGQTVIWTRKSTLLACEAVGLTAGVLRQSSDSQAHDAVDAVLDWLKANKPKHRHPFGSAKKSEGVGDGGDQGDGGGVADSSGMRRPEVEGEEEAGAENDVSDANEGEARERSDGGGSDAVSEDKGLKWAREEGKGELTHSPKRRRLSSGEGLATQSGGQRERREEGRLRRSEERKRLAVGGQAERAYIPPPKSVGRSKAAAELEAHRRATKKREKARSVARELVGEALKQQRRSNAGKRLTADEQELANFAKTLSPVKLLGAGFRVADDHGDDFILPSEDEEAIDELMEETGCRREDARDALDRSCDWTANGRPSRVKAARWLREQVEVREGSEGEGRNRSDDDDVECVGGTAPGGARRSTSEAAGECRGRSSTGVADGDVSGDEVPGGRRSGSCSGFNRKTVQKRKEVSDRGESREESGSSNGTSESDFSGSSEGFVSDPSSANSESGSSDSESSCENGKAGEKRMSSGRLSLSSRARERSGKGETQRSARYVRQLVKVLKIDESWAREVYDACSAAGTTSYDGLLRYFYRQQVQHAKGTQKETTRELNSSGQQQQYGGMRRISVNMPTFQLPEWSQGQPPNGGVHFSTLQKMLEAYERYDKQTNYETQVTFKSMVKDRLKPNFESKCKLPTTVWLPPREDDWREVANGREEQGGWSDLRFLRRVRKALQPKGRTSYEIAFESMILRHKGNDEQLVVALDLWGTNWLAKEREAEEQGKALPAQKMKSYFKKAVAGVARFRRWLEGRTFISSKDWYGVLCRKLHCSMGKSAEAAYDRDREGNDRGREGGDGGYGGGWRSGRAESGLSGERSSRGGGAYRGGRDGGSSTGGLSRVGTSSRESRPGNFGKISDSSTHVRANAHMAGVGIPPHSGGLEPMESTNLRSPDRMRGPLRGVRGGQRGSPVRFGQGDRAGRQVNPVAEESKEKLPKGPRWHDSKMSACECRDPDCGTRQDVPYCQGCGMHGHDRPYCFKAGEPMFNPSGYWCVNKPNERPIEGLGRRRSQDRVSVATSRSNMMDASSQQ
jgi:hypothetical protein